MKRIISIIAIVISLIGYFLAEQVDNSQLGYNVLGERVESIFGAETEWGKVVKVVDGDTIQVEISGEKQTVRFLGVDTPETVDRRRGVECFGKEASNENHRLLDGEIVALTKDISESDKYGRLLRHVYLVNEDRSWLWVNEYLVKNGFAQVVTYPPDVAHRDEFLSLQEEARLNQRGLWQKCGG